MQLNSRSCTWALNLCDLLISYSISRQNLVVQPHDINMQILVDNNAKPHNQQIINSPWFLEHTPVPHVEKSSHACCKTSDLLHAAKSVIDYSVKKSQYANSHTIFWEISWNIAWPSTGVFRELDM